MPDKNKTGISYFGNRNPRHFISDLEEILSHNCSFIVHTFSENDQEYYKETMRELLALSKDGKKKVHIICIEIPLQCIRLPQRWIVLEGNARLV